ncbi:glycosyltransferase [Chloroflexota bacterium]
MPDTLSNILQISTTDQRGGAARIAWLLHQDYQARGLNSWMAVGERTSNTPQVLTIPNAPQNPVYRALLTLEKSLTPHVPRIKGKNPARIFGKLAQPDHVLIALSGREDFRWNGSKKLLNLPPVTPDILHFHNMHTHYFDLSQLPTLSHRVPTVLTLHDTWTFTGHCAHFIDCTRWHTGCGQCPDLKRPPGLLRDGTAFNFQRKQEIYRSSRYTVVAPSQWLIDHAQQSILADGAVDFRVIPNRIDLTIFSSGDKAQSRAQLALPQDAVVLLYAVAHAVRYNPYKDYTTIRTAIEYVKQNMPDRKIHFVGIGGTAPPEQHNNLTLQFIPYQSDPRILAAYYRAADIFIHAARAETAGITLLEAQACGTPVIATAVGGIPEQIVDGITGFLVPGGGGGTMAAQIQNLLTTPGQLAAFSTQAAAHARQHFGLSGMVEGYLALYNEIIENQKVQPG